MSLGQLTTMLDHAEEQMQSWAYWTMKSFDDITTEGSPFSETLYRANGTLQTKKLRALTRPFAPTVAGVPRSAKFDHRTETFTLEYVTNTPWHAVTAGNNNNNNNS